MKFEPALSEGVLQKRYKRFLADIITKKGMAITIHCPNTGSMLNCQDPGSRIWYSTSDNPKRKYSCTWEIVENQDRHLIGINTSRANLLVEEALVFGRIPELSGYTEINREVPYGQERSRIDFVLRNSKAGDRAECFVEVKNVSLGQSNGIGLFPDSVTVRGQKHLRELMLINASGKRAVLLFCIQHTGIVRVEPADSIDPEYGKLLREAVNQGVELLAYNASLSPSEIVLNKAVPVRM